MDTVGTYAVVPFISGLFNVLIDRLAPENMRELLMGHGSTAAELSKLRTSVMVVKRAAVHAEEKQEIDSDVKNWLNDVKHAVYDAEDLLDHIFTKALRKRVQQSDTESTQHNVSQVFFSSIANITSAFGEISTALNPFHEGIDTRIQRMNQRFEGLSHLIQLLGLRLSQEQPRKMLASQPTSSFVDESKIVGRVSERDRIIQLLEDGLLRDHQGRVLKSKSIPLADNIHVIAIVGMGGIGKTTLAQVIYNHPTTDSMFDMKAWIYFPREFDAMQIINRILYLLPGTSDMQMQLSRFEHLDDLQLLQKNLRQKVVGKRIMIVLDDLWNEILDATWQTILISLEHAAPGSTIIVTTRNEDIARNLRPILIVPLYELPIDDVWTLFKTHAFGDPQAAPDESFETMGRTAVEKCGGLPLAIRALGRLLNRFHSDAIEWETITSSKLWDLHPSVQKEIIPALLLSFYYLPEPVKRCYAYCSIFPKNYQFDKEKLVLQWMAEGFIEMPRLNSGETMEHIGKIYFDDLKARSFFQVSKSEQHHFVMHDMIHDLAVFVMGGFGLMLEPNNSHTVEGMLRHFSYKQSRYDTDEKFRLNDCAHQLRTFLPVESKICAPYQPCYYLSNNILQSLKQFCCLRVLSLCGYKITNIPPSIGSLELLRYVDFSFTYIEELPGSICDLLNLQTLILSYCRQLRKLPTMTRNLVHLRHLDLRGTTLQDMPNHLGSLSCLQTLTDFVVGEDTENSFRGLGDLTQLRGILRIYGSIHVLEMVDAFQADLRSKAHLDELALMQFIMDENCLDALKPHTNLRRLTLGDYAGYKFPSWVGDEAFCYLEVLHLENCSCCVKLPPLGQLPSLKHLLVGCCFGLETVGAEFYGQHNEDSSPFKSLVTLEFKNLKQWRKWFTYGGVVEPFLCLEKLSVQDCGALEGNIPLWLPSLVDLDIKDCDNLHGSLPDLSNLRKLRLEGFGKLDLSSLAEITRLTELSLVGVNHNDWIVTAKEALPLMSSLEKLTIRNGSVTLKQWHLPSSVRSITIDGNFIEQFDTFIEGCTNLQYLCIKGLKNSLLQFPPGHSQLLSNLYIEFCDKIGESQIIVDGDDLGLESLHEMTLSRMYFGELNRGLLAARNLTTLTLSSCWKLRSLPNGMASHFPRLQFLAIERCGLFGTFPQGDLPPNLQTLKLKNCLELRSLSNYMSICTSLQRLSVENCSNLYKVPERCLPPNLKFLELSKTLNYAKWQLNQLNSVQELIIHGNQHAESFPANGSLPNSLTILSVGDFSKLRSINCRELQRIPCLRELEIVNCKSLLSLCDGGLPQSLYRLTIKKSPDFAKRCRKPDGHYVDVTSHITCLKLV